MIEENDSNEREYFVHVLNWPIAAGSLEEAARIAARSMVDDPTGFCFVVTEEEGSLRPLSVAREEFAGFEAGAAEKFDSNEFVEDEYRLVDRLCVVGGGAPSQGGEGAKIERSLSPPATREGAKGPAQGPVGYYSNSGPMPAGGLGMSVKVKIEIGRRSLEGEIRADGSFDVQVSDGETKGRRVWTKAQTGAAVALALAGTETGQYEPGCLDEDTQERLFDEIGRAFDGLDGRLKEIVPGLE